ncbi:MAG: nitrogenase component 1 [Rubrobacteraceae bacterium]
MTILNESGIPDVLSPLQAVNDLAERFPGARVFVVGTRSEAHLAQTLPALTRSNVTLRPNPRVSFMVLEPDGPPEEGQVAARTIEAVAGSSDVDLVLVLTGRPADLLGLDVAFEARLAARRLDLPVKAVDLGSSSACLCTDLEDSVLAALVEICPGAVSPAEEVVAPPPKRPGFLESLYRRNRDQGSAEPTIPVVLAGALSQPETMGELAAELRSAGVAVAGTVPGERAIDLPVVDENTVVAVTDPYLTSTARAFEERGARVVRTLMPIGIDATGRFVRDVAAAAGRGYNELGRVREMHQRLEHLRGRIRGKRVFFAGDTGLEIPLARFLADAGAVVLEVGAPRLDRQLLSAELQALGSDVDVVESPDWQGQMERIDTVRPDVVIASSGIYVPLVARGHLCRSSLDFARLGIHGYEGARRILELFVRTFERAAVLDSVNL